MLGRLAKRSQIAFALWILLWPLGCGRQAQTGQSPNLAQGGPVEQDLRLTFGGFPQEHPEEGKLEGVCGTDSTRNVLDCDVYNGLAHWTVKELTLEVTWFPFGEDNKRFYSESVSIEPLKTEHVSIRLGLQLPGRVSPPGKRWGWLIANAKGHRIQ